MEARSIVQAVGFQVIAIQSRRDGTEDVATATASLMFDLSEHWIVKPKHSGTELTRKAHLRQPKQSFVDNNNDFVGVLTQLGSGSNREELFERERGSDPDFQVWDRFVAACTAMMMTCD